MGEPTNFRTEHLVGRGLDYWLNVAIYNSDTLQSINNEISIKKYVLLLTAGSRYWYLIQSLKINYELRAVNEETTVELDQQAKNENKPERPSIKRQKSALQSFIDEAEQKSKQKSEP